MALDPLRFESVSIPMVGHLYTKAINSPNAGPCHSLYRSPPPGLVERGGGGNNRLNGCMNNLVMVENLVLDRLG